MTLAELQASLQAKGYATDTLTAQTNALNRVYARVLGLHRWPFIQAQTGAVTVAGTATVSLAAITDLRDNGIDAVRLSTSAADRLSLDYMEPQSFRDLQHSFTDYDEPLYWTVIDNQLTLWPTPIRAYTVTIDYAKKVADLAAAGDTPVFDSTYHELLVWGAVADIAYRERDYSGAAWANQQYMMRVGEMERAYGVRQKQTSRQVKRSPFWGSVGRGGDRDGWV